MQNLFLFSHTSKVKTKFVNEWKSSQGLVYSIVKDDEINAEFSFEKSAAAGIFSKDKNEFFNKILSDFENLIKKHEKVLVLGLSELGFFDIAKLNLQIAKSLNTPVIFEAKDEEKEIASKFLKENLYNKNFALINENFNLNELAKLEKYDFLTTYRFKFNLTQKCLENKKTIVLPESDDERILKAADILLRNDLVNLILLGDEEKVQSDAKRLNLNLSKAKILNPLNSVYNSELANALFEARKAKGMSEEQAANLIKDRNYFATLLTHLNHADGVVSGAAGTTADTIRPALQVIKTKEGVKSVSGLFFIGLEDRVLAFADCAVTPTPSTSELAASAFISAQTARNFGLDPKVALLSYSTGDSAKGECIDFINEALNIAKENYKDLIIDGPMQFDAAFNADVGARKMPDSKVAGVANVFIFPNLDCANICYKAVQRTANALAIGPLLQGLKKPVNDLSRGCLIDDIVDTVILTAIQAQ